MRKIFLLAAVVALFAAWAGAQQQNNASAQNHNQATVRGCLTGSDGQYRLVDDSHVVYMLAGQDRELSGFDGQRVEVTGKVQERVPPKEKQTASSFNRPELRLRVASINRVSDTCTGATE